MRLPDNPADGIRLAIQDLRACHSEPQTYRVDMCFWHIPFKDGICHVCLAGAVMAKTLGAPQDHHLYPQPGNELSLSEMEAYQLSAFDMLRSGDVENFLETYCGRDVDYDVCSDDLSEWQRVYFEYIDRFDDDCEELLRLADFLEESMK